MFTTSSWIINNRASVHVRFLVDKLCYAKVTHISPSISHFNVRILVRSRYQRKKKKEFCKTLRKTKYIPEYLSLSMWCREWVPLLSLLLISLLSSSPLDISKDNKMFSSLAFFLFIFGWETGSLELLPPKNVISNLSYSTCIQIFTTHVAFHCFLLRCFQGIREGRLCCAWLKLTCFSTPSDPWHTSKYKIWMTMCDPKQIMFHYIFSPVFGASLQTLSFLQFIPSFLTLFEQGHNLFSSKLPLSLLLLFLDEILSSLGLPSAYMKTGKVLSLIKKMNEKSHK